MHQRTIKKLSSYAFSSFLGLLFFMMGAGVLYADYKRTSTVTSALTSPSVVVQQPTIDVEKSATVTTTTVTQEPTVFIPAEVTRQQVHEYITYDINVKKRFLSNENVRGEVVVNNASGMALADSFYIRLYQNNKLKKEIVTRMTNILPGQTRFSFEQFGIPQINETPAAAGHWTISIYDIDPAYSKEADFDIVAPTS